MKIGVLALQGAVAPHLQAIDALGGAAVEVRRPEHLDGLDGLILPGGESTTMNRLLVLNELFEPMAQLLRAGLPVFGTCAGMILLAAEVLDGRPDQETFGVIDIAVRRNAFGRQIDSFETDLVIDTIAPAEDPLHAVFIRAPFVESTGAAVEVLARVDGHPVCARQGAVLVTAFHPELAGDHRLHQAFLAMIEAGARP